MIEGGVDDAIGLRGSVAQRFRRLKRPEMHLRAGLLEPLRAVLGARQAEDLVAGLQELRHDPRADKASGAGDKDPHAKTPMVLAGLARPNTWSPQGGSALDRQCSRWTAQCAAPPPASQPMIACLRSRPQ